MHSTRRLLNARWTLLAAIVAGCSSGPSAPNATVLRIRLFDDGGQPAGRHQVVVASALGVPVTRVSGGDGTLDVALADGGSYRVSVIPRAGFVSTPALTRQVQVSGHARSVIDFTIPRAGISAGNGL